MKRLFVIGMGFLMALMFAATAFCEDGPYVGGHIGLVLLKDSDYTLNGSNGKLDFDPGFGIGVFGGYKYKFVRVEGEIGSQSCSLDTDWNGGGHHHDDEDNYISNSYILGNVYFDFLNRSRFTPYVTAGAGVSSIALESHSTDLSGEGDDIVFAYQFGAGVGYELNKKITIDVKYRYFATSDPDLDGLKMSFKSHNVYVGVRYNF